jgi:orotate phosphoribosyltransferase
MNFWTYEIYFYFYIYVGCITKTALLVEDVTTTGGSVISAVQALRDEGLFVRKVISVVDRDEGAEEALDKEGLDLISLVRAKTLLEDYEVAEALRHSGGIRTNDELFADKGR